MEQEQVIGPVQFSTVRMAEPQLLAEVRRALEDPRAGSVDGIRMVDALVLRKNTYGTIDQQTPPDLTAETQPTGEISRLLNRVEAEGAHTSTPVFETYEASSARAALFRGEAMPDHRDATPEGKSALVDLIEHRWAAPFRDAVLRTNATPSAVAG